MLLSERFFDAKILFLDRLGKGGFYIFDNRPLDDNSVLTACISSNRFCFAVDSRLHRVR